MARKGSDCGLLELDKFLSPQLLGEAKSLSSKLEALRRREVPLEGEDAQRAKMLLQGTLKGLQGMLKEIEASLIAGLPSEK